MPLLARREKQVASNWWGVLPGETCGQGLMILQPTDGVVDFPAACPGDDRAAVWTGSPRAGWPDRALARSPFIWASLAWMSGLAASSASV